jgi:hypothetical protein
VPIAAGKTGILQATASRSGARLLSIVSLTGLSACLLTGCATQHGWQDGSMQVAKSAIPLPERSLLKPQPEPGCTTGMPRTDSDQSSERGRDRAHTKVASLATPEQLSDDRSSTPVAPSQSMPTLSQADPNAGLTTRIRLEYERNCFQRAELSARQRLHRLQASVARTVAAVRRREMDGR